MNFMATTSVPKAERLRTVRALALKEAIDRFNHELMDDEERMLLLELTKRLRKALGAARGKVEEHRAGRGIL
jgi:hypothetical protein